ncbi:dihydrofolate reductase family protein [Gordonia shandongensis]|uniref:dihydrofolate reductase family protein n=1 Tax=Gordonia shandongensis TaxID=376351 RepID=UPI001FE1F692|nr:dihydrofolate reductase family protein [Gordonia shandongensis]
MQKATEVTGEALIDLYRFPPSAADGRPVVRGNMVVSIDGAATADGRSAGLASADDTEIFHLQRGLCDAILVGANTAVTEGYRVPSTPERYTTLRAENGQREVPLLMLTSRSLDIPTDYPPLGAPGVVIATCRSAPADARARLAAVGATIIDCGDQTVDPVLVVDELARRGLHRVLCEGGPRFLTALAAAGRLDELALTVSPHLVGGDAPRIAHGPRIDGDPGLPMVRRHELGDAADFRYELWERRTG